MNQYNIFVSDRDVGVENAEQPFVAACKKLIKLD